MPTLTKETLITQALKLAKKGAPSFLALNRMPGRSNAELGVGKGEERSKVRSTDPSSLKEIISQPRATELAVPMEEMNRKQRRAAKAKARMRGGRSTIDPIVSAHEAGHAIARYLTAAEMGYTPEKSISQITISAPNALPYMGQSFDGKATLYSQAVTEGPMVSMEMDDSCKQVVAATGRSVDEEFLSRVVSKARENGADIETWLRARALIAVMGSAVEAAATRKNIHDVLYGYECENDLNGFTRDCIAAQVQDEVEKRIDDAVRRALEYLMRQDVCDAVNALATHLVKNGSTSGKTATRIIGGALESKCL